MDKTAKYLLALIAALLLFAICFYVFENLQFRSEKQAQQIQMDRGVQQISDMYKNVPKNLPPAQ